jgi:amino acid adenylation domain-containing protein
MISPTDLASLEGFSAEKLELLACLVEDELELAPEDAIIPQGNTAEFPLSFAQQRLWFLEQLTPDSALYNILFALSLKGSLDRNALEQSINEIVRRHDVLRTKFQMRDAQPIQIICESVEISLESVDIHQLLWQEKERRLRALIHELYETPFDLVNGPLVRARLLRLDQFEHILFLTMHHIVSDGWSMRIFTQELAALYEAFSRGQSSSLPELPIQYADFAIWQRKSLSEEVIASYLQHWKEQLDGAPTTIQLPIDYSSRPTSPTFRGAMQSLELSAGLSDALNALSRQEGTTLFMTLLTAFAILLYRYASQDTIVIGTPIANRNRTEIEPLIGFFVNMLPLRIDLADSPSFRKLLKRVQQTALEAYEYQDVPFERLVEDLQPDRQSSQNPLFQVVFAFQNMPLPTLETDGLSITPLPIDSETAKFDLTLFMENTEPCISGGLEYNTDLFTATTISRMRDHFCMLLQSIVANPDLHISKLPLLTDTEMEQILDDWNETRSTYPHDQCVHWLFEKQARQMPNAVAVTDGDRVLTYAMLDARSNQLARHLRELGVGPESRAGICLERSIDMVVGLLGILKAGGAYVPIDPAYPQERIDFMLEDAQAVVLFTKQHLAEELASDQKHVICLDADWESIAQESPDHLDVYVSPENLAYVIYTSGSTGKPKGVMIQHQGLVNLISWHQRVYEVTSADRATQLASPAFDASVWELWPYLTAGASIHIPDQELCFSPSGMTEWLINEGITISFLPTPLAEAVLKEAWPQDARLKRMLTGGDKLHRSPPETVPFQLINHYGPTEDTVVTTCAAVPAEAGANRAPPIGRPIENTQVYLLDAHLQPVPVGVAGELYIGGDGLARGYLDRASLTAERFIPHPFSDVPGARVDRTGDLARYLPDGNIEFLGRADHQVKVRGFRIELGEIESMLVQHPAIEKAIALVREDGAGGKQVVSYIVARDRVLDMDGLRRFLRRKLPGYMVPTAFVVLDAMPLTPNGKVDRQALPSPDWTECALDFVAPRNPIEETLAGLWCEVLEIERVGVHDDFFELGGHSLKVTQLVSKLREVFDLDLPLRAVFESPTIAGLSEHLDALQWATQHGHPALSTEMPGREVGEL